MTYSDTARDHSNRHNKYWYLNCESQRCSKIYFEYWLSKSGYNLLVIKELYQTMWHLYINKLLALIQLRLIFIWTIIQFLFCDLM